MIAEQEPTQKKNFILIRGFIECLLFALLILPIIKWIQIPKIWFIPMFPIFGFLWLGSYLWVRKVVSYNHRFRMHPTSYLGQTFVKGKSNMRGYWWYFSFSWWLSSLPFAFGWLLSSSYSHLLHMDILILFLVIGAIGIFGQGAIPINLSYIGHIISTILAFTGMIAMNIILWIFFSRTGYLHSFLLRIPALIQIACSTIYMFSYIFRSKPGFNQKFWLFSFVFALIFYGVFFSAFSVTS